MPTLMLNDRDVSFETGRTILEVARENDVQIPTLCHLEGTTPTGACRIYVVEVRGARGLVPSCATPAVEGIPIGNRADSDGDGGKKEFLVERFFKWHDFI